MKLNQERTHDKLYLYENRKETPKEYFKFIIDNAKNYIDNLSYPEILDIGCATGDFLYYFGKIYPDARKYGVDIMDELLSKAKNEVDEAIFLKGNIEKGLDFIETRFDAIFMSGVHSIFDNFEIILDNTLSLLKEHGRVYIFGIFNPEPIDVMIRSRKSNYTEAWETGWNLFSIETVKGYLYKRNLDFDFKEFNLDIELRKKNDDPLRTWTMKLDNGDKIVMNGLQLVHTFYLLEIVK